MTPRYSCTVHGHAQQVEPCCPRAEEISPIHLPNARLKAVLLHLKNEHGYTDQEIDAIAAICRGTEALLDGSIGFEGFSSLIARTLTDVGW